MTTFFDLPMELRDHVYTLAMGPWKTALVTVNPDSARQPPISRVCRQLRVESLPIFYSVLSFQITLNSKLALRPGAPGFDWLRAIGKTNLNMVREIQLVGASFSVTVAQADSGRSLELKALHFGIPILPINLKEEDSVRKSLSEALDFIAGDVDEEGKVKQPGLTKDYVVGLFFFVIYAAIRDKHERLWRLDLSAREFVRGGVHLIEPEHRLAKKLGLLN
ncbi:hypothetical protein LTR37_016044 [Vermiconidia calcicola]|uniref:Uncharacterized protein n=1 Tax=Vermiconidia calcicola TaxID=1690605 RepID=A0ACC3MNZ2_9PEZI|nr:hypothetical protein LTR37_016044 [Vermiconidia calcicola]